MKTTALILILFLMACQKPCGTCTDTCIDGNGYATRTSQHLCGDDYTNAGNKPTTTGTNHEICYTTCQPD